MDVAIAQFRFLTRLLLVHGLNYVRYRCTYSFTEYCPHHINDALSVLLRLVGFIAVRGDGVQASISSCISHMYIGIIDQDITAETAHTFPASYAVDLPNSDLNLLNIIKYIIQALFMGCVVFLPLVLAFSVDLLSTIEADSADGQFEASCHLELQLITAYYGP